MGEKDKGFSKTDMERIGVFQEMTYISIGDRFKAAGNSKYMIIYIYIHTHIYICYQVRVTPEISEHPDKKKAAS